jgi:GrpB-like predicted nucleotidyltransferase (UPF0157 family)
VLRILVVGSRADAVADRLRELDSAQRVRAAVGQGVAGFVVATEQLNPEQVNTADFVVTTDAAGAALPCGQIALRAADCAAVERLWRERLAMFAQNVVEGRFNEMGAPALEPSSPEWTVTARRLMARVTDAVAGLVDGFDLAHIGSTSVQGLAAKPIIDLQLGVPALDRLDGIEQVLAAVGFVDVAPTHAGSPGVLRDHARGRYADADGCWGKRLFASADPGQRAILHVREIGSPWWGYTVQFRDWLRAHAGARAGYQRMKLELAEAHATDPDCDQYTIAKTAWFDAVQPEFEAWAATR